MAAASSIQSGLPTDYYAPDFRIEVENVELDPTSKGDVLQLKVTMDKDNLTSCQLTISNWDAREFALKYSDKRTFDIGNHVHVQLGYADAVRSMMRGQISTLSPRFPESGQPTIEVSVLDGMLHLRDRKPKPDEPKKFVQKADWEIAQLVARRNGLDSHVTEEGERHELVLQKNQDDAAFLMERARRIDFECYVATDPGSGKDALYFVRPSDARDASTVRVYEFEWGRSLISFTPKITLSRQVAEVTVRGWDARAKEPIVGTATSADLPPGGGAGTSGPAAAEKVLGGKQELVVDAPVTSKQEARELAVSILRERAYQFMTGTARAIGIPDLRPGDNVDLKGLGKRFSGRYYVTKVEHTLSGSGYFTEFEVRSPRDGGVQ